MEEITRKEYYENGKLWYEEVICVLPEGKEYLYQYRMKSQDGYYFIYVRKTKYFDNGQFAWELNYDKNGKYVKNDKPSYRKDGTGISYT